MVQIKLMETDAETQGKAYVHWKSWQETYPGLVDKEYLRNLTLEKCAKTAFQWPDNILVAKENDRVIGFAAFGAYRDDTLPDTGEIYALYVLQSHQGKKIGYALMCAALQRLEAFHQVALWVLTGNERAISFYQKVGFSFDGTSLPIPLGTDCMEQRMILPQKAASN